MWPYLIPLIFSIFCAVRYDIKEKQDEGKLFGYIFLFLYLTLLIGLRYRVGGDSLTYEQVFNNSSDLSGWEFTFIHIYQPGFTFLISLVKSIYPEFVFFQIIHVLIINTLLFIFLWKQTKYRYIAISIILIMVYIGFTTEVLRESIAVLITALFYPYLRKRKIIKYYLGVALACFFHISAIVLVIVPWISWIRFNKHFFLILVGVLFISPILSKFFGIFSDNLIAEKFNDYDGQFYGFIATFIPVLRNGLFPLLYLFIARSSKESIKFENMVCIMTLLGCAAIVNPIIFGRSVNYFVLFFILSLTAYLHSHLSSSKRVLRNNACIIILCFILSCAPPYLYLNKYVKYVPYSSVLNPVDYNRNYYLVK